MLQNCLEIILLTVWLFAIWRPETIGHQQEVTTYCAAYTLCFFQNKQQVYSYTAVNFCVTDRRFTQRRLLHTVRLQVQPTTVYSCHLKRINIRDSINVY